MRKNVANSLYVQYRHDRSGYYSNRGLLDMDNILRYARQKQTDIIALIQSFVECESPSDDSAAVNRFADLFIASVEDICRARTISGGRYGKHVRCEFELPGQGRGSKNDGQILALGHSDTVWPLGAIQSMPFRKARGRLWGPGVFDMKAGLAFFVSAMRALRDLDVPVKRKVILQINSDEEVGSPASRRLTEQATRRSVAVLVLEPGTGLEGKLKTARKGVGDYTVVVRGRSSHAGVDFESGANAIIEMSRQIERIAAFTRINRGVTVSPGVIRGGTRSNVVAAECMAEIDVRIRRKTDEIYLQQKFASLKPYDKRCSVQVSGGINRPPLERTASIRKLFRIAQSLAAELGVELEESATGGGSDGNFTAALGIPTLDGLGAVGEGAHAPHESILIDRIADRTALLAKLVARL
jgi:glutamate carboxypeptidase